MRDTILDFNKINKNHVDLAGGKGASLGEMTQAGIPVPPGYVILSHAFDEFTKDSKLNQKIDSILGSVDHQDIKTVDSASEKIQGLILDSKMPNQTSDKILDSFKKLDTEYVAVRSSATSEDSASDAWAGQLDTYLNTTDKNLLENVRRCWASLFTPRAIFYRFEKNLHNTKISVAVVVQKMIDSDVSGIAFSVHPVTKDENQMIIEAGFGLGEAVVSGSITPDSYIVEKEEKAIAEINFSPQEKALVKNIKGGNIWKPIPKNQQETQKLSGEKIIELSQMIHGIEKHYGFPCDIEWALEGNKFYITQSRPITTL